MSLAGPRAALITLLALAIALAQRTDARAAPSSWEVAPDAPCTEQELRHAVAARALDGALRCSVVSLTRIGAQALVRCDTRSRAIELGDRRGADAARAAAVVLLELAAPAAAAVQLPAPAAPSAAARLAPPPRAELRGRAAGLLATGVSRSDFVQHGVAIAVDLEARRWGATLAFAYDRSRHNRTSPTPDVIRVAARAASWRRLGAWSLGASVTATATSISRTGDYDGMLWAVGPLARGDAVIADGHWLFVELTASFFPHRVRVSPTGSANDLLSTPRVQLELAVGYQWRFTAW